MTVSYTHLDVYKRQLFAQAEDDIAYLCENGAIVYRGGSVVSKLAMELSLIHI